MQPLEREELDEEQVQQLKAGMPLAVAEQRMQEAWWALGAASVQGVSRRQLSTLEEAYTQALTSYETSHHVRPDHGRGDVSELRYLGTLMGGRRDTEVDS